MLHIHREVAAQAATLNFVRGRLTEWTALGLLLLGDAAHPMSPVGGQGPDIALRDTLAAANHLCRSHGLAVTPRPSMPPPAVSATSVLEIVTVQGMQELQGRLLLNPNGWKVRLTHWSLPLPI